MVAEKTVIVSSITVFAARLIQEKHRVPLVTVHNIPMGIKSAYEMPQNGLVPFPNWLPLALKRLYWWIADKAVIDPLICPELNAFRKELGLSPVSRIMTRWGHSPQMVIGLFPDWFAQPQPDWPPETRLTGFPLFDEGQESAVAPEIDSFLAEGEPPVVFLPASLMQQANLFFETAVQACQEAGKRAILLTRYRSQVPSVLPDGIQHFEYIPLQHILSRAAALVHQGGIGTCAQALRGGVPQLIRPLAYDQYDNAGRVKRLGVGDWIPAENWNVPTVTAKIQAVTTSSAVHQRCQTVASKFEGTDSLLETCKLVEFVL
jgi:UDP:flavonoid glycosyltransferase YjiC (YdhE family)